jgi:dihydrofolate synthase/folylpolyglutamate synthase
MSPASEALDAATIEYLVALKRRGVALGLERMRRLLAALDDPHRRIPVVHVAGTNGKGSVSAMLEAMLRSAGWRTGLYTSPHLVSLGERIQLNRQPLSSRELAEAVGRLRVVVETLRVRDGEAAVPSYFEFMTALAFAEFARAGCDIAVVEVGMGGRLDATNVVHPEVSAITSIGLDHTEFLGNSLGAIAAEKAGIIKAERPVVIGRLPAEAEQVVRAVAAANHAPVISVAEAYVGGANDYPRTNLNGDYQRLNAATATLVARQLDPKWRLTEPAIAAALRQVSWPARWQRCEVGGRVVVVDSAHNEEGAAVLAQNLAALVAETGCRPVVVVGVLGASRARPLLAAIAAQAAEIWLVVPSQRRACSYDELEALIPAAFRGRVRRARVVEIFPSADRCLPEFPVAIPVVVTGSIYLAGEVLAQLEPNRGPVQHELQDF